MYNKLIKNMKTSTALFSSVTFFIISEMLHQHLYEAIPFPCLRATKELMVLAVFIVNIIIVFLVPQDE